MRDEAIAVSPFAPDFDAEERTDYGVPEREFPAGSQPIPVEEDVMHVRHVGEQAWHRVIAGGMTTNGYECACSRIIEYSLAETRTQANRGTPCMAGCFTDFERAKFIPEVAGTWKHFLDGPHKEKK